MPDSVLLPAVGLCMASMITAVGARLVDRLGVQLSRPLWFLLVSLSMPLVWIAFQAIVLVIIIPDPAAHAGLVRKWPMYLRDVLFGIAFKLWLCGALCAAVLAFFRRSKDDPRRDALVQCGLLHAGGAIAAAIILPMAMEYWIDTGELSGRFVLFTFGCAFIIGVLPTILASFVLLRAGSAAAHLRYAESIVALYAAVILWRGYAWHQAVANRPGASAVTAVEVCALAGVFAGWLAIRRGNRAALQALKS